MISTKRSLIYVAAFAAALSLTACGSSAPADSGGAAAGEPVVGGTGTFIQTTEPRTLNPGTLGNSAQNSTMIGNGIYGELFINDPATGDIVYRLAEDFSSADGGATFTLKLRDGVTFSDGSPFTAEAVKANWDHRKDPASASSDIPQASLIAESTVVDPLTLSVTLTDKIPGYASSIYETSMNWIAAPESLSGSQEAMDSNPIGAGPYVLGNWSRQDKLTLVRNDKYSGDPGYLDELDFRFMSDGEQAYNTVISQGADLAFASGWVTYDRAAENGLETISIPIAGATGLALNNRRAPFDDVRARTAFVKAIDRDAVNEATAEGAMRLPETMFEEESPFYSDIPITEYDPEGAQELFDELAADGKPFEVTLGMWPGSGTAVGEAIQAQLSAYDNATSKVVTNDLANYGALVASRDYDVFQTSLGFVDPDPRAWLALHSDAAGNHSGVADAELDAALAAGRATTDVAERKAAYATLQERFVELNPMLLLDRLSAAAYFSPNVHGVQMYGYGSILPGELWISK